MSEMVAESSERADTSALQRVRSAALLVLMVILLGALAAGIIGVLAVALTSLVDNALG
ncbi:MAG: hypothetical protein ACOYXM_08490 [Actinomycetota bacterium]